MKNVRAEEFVRKVPAELSLEDPAHYVQSIMDSCSSNYLPVTMNGELLGMVSRPETIAATFFSGPGYLVVQDFMKARPASAHASLALPEVAFLMAMKKLDCLPVVGEKKQFLGMIHIHDIVTAFLGEFAEKLRMDGGAAVAA